MPLMQFFRRKPREDNQVFLPHTTMPAMVPPPEFDAGTVQIVGGGPGGVSFAEMERQREMARLMADNERRHNAEIGRGVAAINAVYAMQDARESGEMPRYDY